MAEEIGLTQKGRQALEAWPEKESICSYLVCALLASIQDDPRPLDPPGTVVRALCPHCKAVTGHELRQGPPGPAWYSYCLRCEGRSHDERMCDCDQNSPE